VLVMINTTLVIALSYRLQSILATLKTMRLPYFIYLPSAVMLRFIPSSINDA
jgi:energy-coupling factor transport system permease protein